jgi:rhomboid protease GluP
MRLLRAAWHPLTPVLLVAVVLPLSTLLAPADQRIGWLALDFVIGGPLAAAASILALRSALARIPIPEGASASSAQERIAGRSLRWLLALAAVLGPLTMYLAALGAEGLARYQIAFLCLVPLLFAVMGWRLWRDLASARRRRARGLEPLPLERATWTGDARLDALIGRRPKVTGRLVWAIAFVSALAYLSPGHLILGQLAMVDAATQGVEIWRYLTASFVHSDLVGLAVSAMVFFAVAPLVEVLVGPRWLVAVLLGGGVAATAASVAFLPGQSYMGMTGATAALTGLLLFFAVRQRTRLPPASARRIALHGLAAVVILAFAGVLLPTTDTAAHLGGFTFGAVAGLLVPATPAVTSALERARQEALAAA